MYGLNMYEYEEVDQRLKPVNFPRIWVDLTYQYPAP